MGTGRPNKGADHVDAVDACAGPRQRLRVILETMSGARTVVDACAVLRVSPTRFRQLRQQALQGAVDALAPRRPGRPRVHDAPTDAKVAGLRAELAYAKRRRAIAETRAALVGVVDGVTP